MTKSYFIDISNYSTTECYIDFSNIPVAARNYVYVNSYKISDLTNCKLSISAGSHIKYMYVHVNPLYLGSFTATIGVSVTESGSQTIIKTISYSPSLIDIVNADYENTTKFINNNTSYQLLRVNPKLTGNIKVVVTSNNDMFLDTFKVSDGLSQYKYRHIKINPEEYYGTNLMSKFSGLPSTDFYKIKDSCYNIFTAVQDYNSQYYDVYNCGVRTNSDKLYSDNFALLAPLCIKETMPDFFLIFKVDTANYTPSSLTESDKIKFFLKNGKLVKSFDMREDSNIGKYIRKIYSNATAYPGDGFVSYESNNYNKFIGISVDRGVVTSAYESMFDEYNDVNNQTALNDFYTLGFERNKLVSKDIVNFEFMFNDTEERLFSLNTYFGIYVKLNSEANTFSCIGYDASTGVYQYDNTVHSFPKNTDMGPDSSYPYYIYGISTPSDFIRLDHSFIDNSINEQYMLKPYQNVLNGLVNVESTDEDKSFVVIDLDKPLDVGDHIRCIDTSTHIIYETICTNYAYALDSNEIGYVVNNYYDTSLGVRWTFKRINMYIPFRDDVSEDDYESTCIAEINQLKLAFNSFDTESLIARSSDNRLSVLAVGSDFIFERIAATPGYNASQKATLKENTEESKTVKYYGSVYADTLLLDIDSTASVKWYNSPMFYLYPIHFETLGMRIATACKFLKLNNLNASAGYHIEAKDITVFDKYTILYQRYDDTLEKFYTKYDPYDFTFFTADSSNNIKTVHNDLNYTPGYKLAGMYSVNMNNPVISNSSVSFYSAYPLNTGICSIFNIKDFDFDVLDTVNNIQYRDGEVIGHSGEYNKPSVFGNTVLGVDEEDIKDYLDKYRKFYDTSNGEIVMPTLDSDDKRNTFFYNLFKNKHNESNISMTAPYCCKWKANGTDARGENMRIMYDFNDLIATQSYYIPYSDSTDSSVYTYTEDLGYELIDSSVFDKYIEQNINDIVISTDDVSTGTFDKKYIIYGDGRTDDILYNNNSVFCKESAVYPAGNNTIEFISGGVKFRISSENDDILNFNTYTGFTASFITVPDVNVDHATATELIIDEVNKQMLFIWYQGFGGLVDTDPNVYHIFHTSSVNDCRCIYNDSSYILTPSDSMIGILPNSTSQLFLVSSKFSSNNQSYTNFANIVIQSDASGNFYDSSANLSFKTYNPIMFVDSSYMYATDTQISRYSSNYYNTNELFMTDSSTVTGLSNVKRTYSDLLNDISNCGIFVKKNSGGKDYTNLSNIIKISIIPSFLCTRRDGKFNAVTSGYVHSCYIQPVMKDMMSFDYLVDTSVCDMFERNFNGANININDIKAIDQLWINKCTNETNYCIPSESEYYRTSLDMRHNVSLLNDCWSSNMYRKYYIDNNIEKYNNIYGYMSGYETNMFLNSRGLNLNSYEGDSLVVSKWRNSKISVRDNYIKINISDSIIYHILFADGYVQNWKDLNVNNNTYRINYIKNYIMTFINIDAYNKFTIYSDPDNHGLTLDDLPSDTSKLTVLENCSHKIAYEDGKYYMYIYPTDKCVHYAKLEIKFNG